jgi:hypothetical protein
MWRRKLRNRDLLIEASQCLIRDSEEIYRKERGASRMCRGRLS